MDDVEEFCMWYEKPALQWTQALPIGNGHMGAMCYSGADGRYDLSENTCWSGKKENASVPKEMFDTMKKAITYLKEEKYEKAEECLCRCNGSHHNYGTQLPMAKLHIKLPKETQLQKRELKLRQGIHTESLRYLRQNIKRTSLIANKEKVMVVLMDTEGGCLPSFDVSCEIEHLKQELIKDKDNKRILIGKACENLHSDGASGVDFCICMTIDTDGQVVYGQKSTTVTNASYFNLFIGAATSMFDERYQETAVRRSRIYCSKELFNLLTCHKAEYEEGADRCYLALSGETHTELPMDERIRAFQESKGKDQGLISLLFQYGRYLLFSSSRKDSLLPAALQGIWNDNRACRMCWTDDFHLDINTQMNYWIANCTNLMESEQPLFQFMEHILYPSGKRTAKDLYGISDAFVAHTVTNAYGYSMPGWEGCTWAFFTSGGAWLTAHIWEHYLYTKDQEFLKKYFFLIKASAKFYQGMTEMVDDQVVFAPSYSPENAFLDHGKAIHIGKNTTVDLTIMRYIYKAYIDGCKILGCSDQAEEMQYLYDRIPPYHIGKKGQLLEWEKELTEAMPDHRHTSHLLALYPFQLLPKEGAFKKAVQRSIEIRIKEGGKDIFRTNWAAGLILLYRAFLMDGEEALKSIHYVLYHMTRENGMVTHINAKGQDTVGIYELDGNTGFTAGVAHMVLQSEVRDRETIIRLLPAIPKEWESGKYYGGRTHGNHVAEVDWTSRRVTMTIYGGSDDTITVQYKNDRKTLKITKGQEMMLTFDR